MENTKNICKRSKLNIDRDDGVKLRPEISMQRSDENTHSILLKRNGNSNEARTSKFSPKRVSFLDDEGQLAILLMPSSGANEKQRSPGILKTHSADVCKSQEAKKQLIIIVGIIFVILALIIVVVVVIKEIQQVLQSQEPEKMNSYVVVTQQKELKPPTEQDSSSTELSKSVPNPELICPPPAILTLHDYSATITLTGANFKHRKEVSVEYIPELMDNSAAYEIPNKLILSRSSIGRNYSVLVKIRDIDGNEAKCRFSIAVKEDPCVPWRLPEEALSTRTEEKTSQGWKVTYQCRGQYGIGTPPALSYYYQDKSAPFTCTSGSAFIPSKSFSCQDATSPVYSYVTSLNYEYLDHDGTKLENITEVKAKSCFEGFYKAKLIEIQEESSKQLQRDIIDVTTKNFLDLSTIKLVPSRVDNPKILEYDQYNDRVHAITVRFGYLITSPDRLLRDSSFNVFSKGILRQEHNNLFSESMRQFNRLKGNVNVGCPDIQAPPDSSIFKEVSSGFSCSGGEKKHSFYDDHFNSEVTICLGCPVGEFYNRDTESCEECPLNMYQDIVGAMECKLCPLNKKTEKTGARSSQECVPEQMNI